MHSDRVLPLWGEDADWDWAEFQLLFYRSLFAFSWQPAVVHSPDSNICHFWGRGLETAFVILHNVIWAPFKGHVLAGFSMEYLGFIRCSCGNGCFTWQSHAGSLRERIVWCFSWSTLSSKWKFSGHVLPLLIVALCFLSVIFRYLSIHSLNWTWIEFWRLQNLFHVKLVLCISCCQVPIKALL